MNKETNDLIFKRLRGTDNFKARNLYRALVEHHQLASCLVCNSYHKYGSMIIKGDLLEHINDIAGYKVDSSDFAKIQQADLIGLEQVAPRIHRIIFLDPAAQAASA